MEKKMYIEDYIFKYHFKKNFIKIKFLKNNIFQE